MILWAMVVGLGGGTMWALPDIDQDGDVDVNDMHLVLQNWGECADPCCRGDIDRDGFVGVFDLLAVLEVYGIYDVRTYVRCR